MKKSGIKALAFVMAMLTATAFVLPMAACSSGDSGNNSGAEQTDDNKQTEQTDDGKTEEVTKTEITYKGETGGSDDAYMGDPCPVYWIDASVQKPDNYTKIIGFNITVKYKSAGFYGGWAEDKTNPMGMLLFTKGAHEPGEYVFTYPNGQTPTYDLSTSDIATFCTGKTGTFVVGTAFSNGIEVTASVGDTVTLSYTGRTALFTESDSIMTAVLYLGSYDIKSVEWITGEPEEVEAIDWNSIKVETTEYTDVRTVEGKDGLTDEEYEAQYPSNYVDITIPDTGKDSYPVILWIHGGGYITGDRKSVLLQNNKEYLLSQGYAFVSVEYTLTKTTTAADGSTVYGEGGMPEMLQDIKLAVRFLRANASKYKLNTNFIAAMGESAGAGLAMLMATTNGLVDVDDGHYEGYFADMYDEDVANRLSSIKYEDTSTGWASYSSDVQAAVTVCAPSKFSGDFAPAVMSAYIGSDYNDYLTNYTAGTLSSYADKDYYDALSEVWSPVDLVSSNTAPLYLAYSKEDTTVVFAFAEAIADAVEENMDEEDYKEVFYEEGGHVDRSVFDSDSSCVDIANWVNTQRDKVLG